MTNHRGTPAALSLLIASLSLAACGSSTPTASNPAPAQPRGTATGSSLTVSGLVTKIKVATGSAGTTCPVAYDIASAGRAAGLTGAVSPADDAVDAVTDSTATGADFLKKVAPAATVQCSYKAGDSTVHILLVAVSHPNSAMSAALPQVGFWSGGDLSALTPFIQKVGTAPVGKAVGAPGNKAAVVRLGVDSGDALLAVAVETSQSLSADQLNALTETLSAQVH